MSVMDYVVVNKSLSRRFPPPPQMSQTYINIGMHTYIYIYIHIHIQYAYMPVRIPRRRAEESDLKRD